MRWWKRTTQASSKGARSGDSKRDDREENRLVSRSYGIPLNFSKEEDVPLSGCRGLVTLVGFFPARKVLQVSGT